MMHDNPSAIQWIRNHEDQSNEFKSVFQVKWIWKLIKLRMYCEIENDLRALEH